ncbi:MAG: efflux RND transporter permease subunit [Candidatus Sumerlaeia bacterium]|nr:efflux RND transporter permease subunit [Candidatus Sumerlaeia bacterium]
MNVAEASIRRAPLVIVLSVLLLFMGVDSYQKLGKLEDPVYTIKRAIVLTQYPGATPEEVENEVTDVIENAVQKMGQLDKVRSLSRGGLSIVYADMKEHYAASDFPQIWDELRRKIHDAQPLLPPGAGPSVVRDDFGDVYGVLLAVVGDGFEFDEIRGYVEDIRRELLTVPDVSRVVTWGEQREVIYLEVSQARLAELGVAPQAIFATLQDQNIVKDSGTVDTGLVRFSLRPSGYFQTVDDIRGVTLRGPDDNLIRLGDIATVRRGYADPPEQLMRFNGMPSLALAISTVPGGNVVTMGDGVRERLDLLKQDLPIGIEFGTVAFQSDTVREAVGGFVGNLVAALVIVIITLLLFVGLRSGLVIGTVLLATIMATLVYMRLAGIDMQRVSLGALIIALGMLVDNAIVVTDGMLVRRQKGMKSLDAARETVAQTLWPLLGATIVAVLAFLAIYLSKNNTGEYTRSLFQVLAASLMISWAFGVTLTPVLCHYFLKDPRPGNGAGGFDGRMYNLYRKSLRLTLTHRSWALLITLGLGVLGFLGMQLVKKEFFPPSTRNQFIVDYWLPEGNRMRALDREVSRVEWFLMDMPGVESVASFIGGGSPRFNLVVETELPSKSYAQLVVTTTDYRQNGEIMEALREYLYVEHPGAEPRLRVFPMGPSSRFALEANFHGPDEKVLRQLSERARMILESDPHTTAVRDNWRQPTLVISPQFDQDRARRAMVSREDLSHSMKAAHDGLPVGLYREGDQLLPILFRLPESERWNLENLAQTQVWSSATGRGVPLIQVAGGIEKQWENPIIWRHNRQRTLTVESDPLGINATELFERVSDKIEAIDLPHGYSFSWGGTRENTIKAQQKLFEGIPISFILMFLTVVALFNAIRQPLIIFAVLPLALVGVAIGLLVTGMPLGFMAILGVLSLSGMMIKNSVVLLDQIDLDLAGADDRGHALTEASVSRLRPIMMAALTTILGMIPLAFDPFFNSMAVAIMAGLLFASLLTLYVVPLLYSVLFGVRLMVKGG